MLIGALVTMLSFSSCTDQDDVEITYDAVTGITAAHIFSGYEPYQYGDFDLSTEGWKLNLQVLVYDHTGSLVDQASKVCSSITETLEYTPKLKPGEYTVISIADFRDGLGGEGYKFWNIENTSSLQDLSITENEDIYTVAFETLGLDCQNITIVDKPIQINADIKSYTALVHVYENNDDHIGYGIEGYSRFVPVCAGYFIRSNKLKSIVEFENNAFVSKYVEQTSDYNITISEVLDDWLDRKNPLQHSYRALLPDKDCTFKWHIQKMDYESDDVFNQFAGNIYTDGISNQSIDIISGKQYVINMILDCLSMDVFEYPEDYKAYDFSQSKVDEFLKVSIDEMLYYNFESILAKDENFANTFLGGEPRKHKWLNTLFVAYYDRPGIERIEVERTIGYLNEKLDCAVIVQFLLPNLSDNIIEYFRQKLSSKYRIDYEYTSPNNYAYIDPDESVDSHYRIVLQKQVSGAETHYFLNYILRNKYLPKDDDDDENNEELGMKDYIFPYHWDSFLRQSIDDVTKTLGNNYKKDISNNILYENYNDLLRSVTITKDASDMVKTITVDIKSTGNESEIDDVVNEYLKSRFVYVNGVIYRDEANSMTVIYMNHRLTYNIR